MPAQIRTGFTLLALVSNDELSRLTREISRELQKIQPESLRKDFATIVADSHEEALAATTAGCRSSAPAQNAAGGKTPNLDQYTVNLTENAKKGKIDPVLGRDVGDSADCRHPHAPAAEQPHSYWRSRGRQDRGGRRLRPARCPRGRSAAAEECRGAHPGSRAVAGRRRRQRRIRKSPKGTD